MGELYTANFIITILYGLHLIYRQSCLAFHENNALQHTHPLMAFPGPVMKQHDSKKVRVCSPNSTQRFRICRSNWMSYEYHHA